ncbi:amino acid permease [Prauserella sp. PE36]|uniref:APC family permease n=1 Tax=Prauserella endophytica TaxID=1592324 RepID=A0ABY2S734_9PSEU|nr:MULTISPECIES: APC family permease [Prauserella]PXY30054.1 amino acid permease [Prauserella coralliicola]RBM12590.1 amino acid permease [Prauserella sp. PE36]TKG71114.1 APC family permease [Prauserella endophytica]
MTDHTTRGGFVRVLGRLDVLAIAFGAMIGFGWIVLTGGFLEDAGSLGAALAFVLGGVVVALVGLTYAELVSAMPAVGGEHNYALRALGSRPGFITSWTLVLGYVSVVAFEAVALPQTLLYLVPELPAGRLWSIAGYDVYATWVAVGVAGAVVITALNYVGVRPAAVFQGIAVLFLLAVGVLLTIGAFVGGSTANMEPLFSGGLSGLLVVLVATPFLFVGFDVIPQSAEEIKLPPRRLGTLLIVSVLLAVTWYVMIMLTVGSGLARDQLAGAELPTADAMSALWNSPAMGTVLVLGGIAGILTSWNGFLIGASRLLFAMASSRMLPRWFARVHPRFGTPSNAVLFVGGLSVAAPLFGEQMLVWLVDAGSLSIIAAYLMVALSFLVLRRREPDMARPFRVPAGRTVGVLAIVLSLGTGVLFLPGMPAQLIWPWEWVIVGLWWLAGVVLVLRLPRIGPGADAEDRLIDAVRVGDNR